MADVYSITHAETGRQYVGVTSRHVKSRWAEHVSVARKQRRSTHFYRALRKYGSGAFDFKVEAALPTFDEAKIAERILIAIRQPAFNSSAGGDGAVGHRHSVEARARMSAAHKGRQPVLGRKASAETRAKMSAAASGKTKSAEWRAKIAEGNRRTWSEGKRSRTASPETRAKMSAAHKARVAARKAE
jgi:group I intron endonuclease